MINKGSDKNVGSIEEDIEILENLKSYLNLLVYEGKDKIIYNDLLWDEKTVDCINAIEHLINNYTRQKQINEEHQKINGELRKKVKELEHTIEKISESSSNNEKLIEKLNSGETFTVNQSGFIKKNFISKQKIKDKMKKYEWAISDYDSSIADYKQSQAIGRWIALQELLQESEE